MIFHSRNICFVILMLIAGCSSNKQPNNTLFELLLSQQTHIDFTNKLEYDKDFNVYTYRNFYNGGGVATGDINNDGLVDIFFSANMGPNHLFLNKGNFSFEDITAQSKITKKGKWSTGVSMADVNADGLLDIYVCNSGDIKGDNKQNELFINNGDLTFTERAAEFGLAEEGYSTHAAFFDYDKDGDLDMYLLNNSFRAIGSFDLRKNERMKRDSSGGHKLLRNDKGHFTDVSEQAGIYGSVIGFGLGIAVSDLNNDGWDDIYVSNDFFERDYLYINNHDGTFREELEKQMMSISNASMGADIADINNDGLADIFTTEMLPKSELRLKTNVSFENWDKYRAALQNGYHHQFTRNALQLNNGNNTYNEIGRFAGVQASDWSWGALVADFNNDGNKDIYVANGIFKDLVNQDYINYISTKKFAKEIFNGNNVDFKKLIDLIPSNPISNCAFMNMGNLRFSDEAKAWGLDQLSFSNGSAYADLDNDGDLDLVVSNVNMPAFIYRNRSRELFPQNNFLRIVLKGRDKNTFALGTKISAYCHDTVFYQQQMPTRGFQSTVDHRLTFGIGRHLAIDSLIAEWPNGKITILRNVPVNTEIILDQQNAAIRNDSKHNVGPALFDFSADSFGIDYQHRQDDYIDFDYDRLIFQTYSASHPSIAKADVNNDGLEDFYICGTKTSPGALFIQVPGNKFEKIISEGGFDANDCVFFDADNDGDKDLYIATGGNNVIPNSPTLEDRLYINNGKGKFSLATNALPKGIFESNSCVTATDFDKDGDIDLFVGVRFKIFKYGYPCRGYILQNSGKGTFTDITSEIAPDLLNAGMITDAEWFDYNNDGLQDLVVTGEYMPLKIFRNINGRFKDDTNEAGLENSNGWWNKLKIADINGDGYDDIIALNHGTNSRFNCSKKQPVTLYVADFDENGSTDQVFCCYNENKQYPMALRHDLISVLPYLKKKFLNYADYAGKQMNDIFTADQLNKSIKLNAYEMHSAVLMNNKHNAFIMEYLPAETQFSEMYAIETTDYDNDGVADLLLGGNFYSVKPEIGIYDASRGILLKGEEGGKFRYVHPGESGLNIQGEIRDITSLKINKKEVFLVALNNESLKIINK